MTITGDSSKDLKGVAKNSIQKAKQKALRFKSILSSNELEFITNSLNVCPKLISRLRTEDSTVPRGKELSFYEPVSEATELLERVVGNSNLMPVWFLEKGVEVQRSVARVVLTQAHKGFPPGTGWATGFMVSPELFLTNNHVIPDRSFLEKIRIQFNFQNRPDGSAAQGAEDFFPKLNSTFYTNPSLDYTLVRLRPNQENQQMPGNRWGFISLNKSPIFGKNQRLNIIQHPDGRRKEIAVQDNEIDRLFENVVLYKSDTEPGSSGSPVFDNLWHLVALHHAGGDRSTIRGKWLNNQGIRIDRVAEDLREYFKGVNNTSVLTELNV